MKFQILVKRRIDRGLKGSSRDPRFKQNTVRDSGNVKWDTGFKQNTVRDSGNVKWDTGFDQNTVRDSGNVKWDTDYGIRDLTATLKAGFTKNLGRGIQDWERKRYSG